MNDVLAHIQTADITETNRVVRAEASVVTRRLGIRKRTTETRKESFLKRRIKSKIDMLMREISELERRKANQSRGGKGMTQIKKYNVKKKGLNVVIEDVKQRVKANAARL